MGVGGWGLEVGFRKACSVLDRAILGLAGPIWCSIEKATSLPETNLQPPTSNLQPPTPALRPPPAESPQKRFRQPAVDGNDMSRRLHALVAREPADRVGVVDRQDRTLRDRALRVELRELRAEIVGRLRLVEGDVVFPERDDDAIAREHRRPRDDGGGGNRVHAHERSEADREL